MPVTEPAVPTPVVTHCSFCGMSKDEVRRLVVGPRVAICDRCVAYCHDVLQADPTTAEEAAAAAESGEDEPQVADPVLARIAGAQERALAGDAAEARVAFADLWDELGPDGDSLHLMTLAHYMADLQDDPAEELVWDLRALEAAEGRSDERAGRHHAGLSAGGMRPSLHLNLAADYARLGRPDDARAHLRSARDAVGQLPEDGYGRMIRTGIDRLGGELDR